MKKEKKSVSKQILKSYEIIKQYCKNNKFNYKKSNNFIYLYVLYIQNKYNLDFGLKGYTKEKLFSKCLQSLYKKNSNEKNKRILFEKTDLIGELFFKSDNFKLDRFLLKLEEDLSSINYVSSNIEFLDYLGNTSNDVKIINSGFCLVLLKEYYPNIKISKNITKTIYNYLIKSIMINKNGIKYTNTQCLLVLFLLKKHNLCKNIDYFISELIKIQLPNGSFPNGYNSYFISNPNEMNILHTSLALIVLLEYQTLNSIDKIKQKKNKIINNNINDNNINNNSINDNNINNSNINDNNINDNNKRNINLYKKQKIKETIEGFDNLINKDYEGSYYFDLNFYNTTAIMIVILILMNINKLKNIKLFQ